MKIKKEFAPVTIILETQQDYGNFLEMLRRGAQAMYREDGGPSDLYEKVCLLIKDLQR